MGKVGPVTRGTGLVKHRLSQADVSNLVRVIDDVSKEFNMMMVNHLNHVDVVTIACGRSRNGENEKIKKLINLVMEISQCSFKYIC